MKKIGIFPVLGATAALVGGVHANPTMEPSEPIGQLNISIENFDVGTVPTLAWETTHPINISDIVEIGEDDGAGENDLVTTKKKLLVKVSMIGTGITDSRGREYDSESEIRFGDGEWQHIFTGPGAAVDITEVLVEEEVEAGTSIEFRSRYTGYSKWRYHSSSEVVALIDGDKPPENPKANKNDTSAEEYMLPYTKGGKLILGALDLIYAAELTHTDTSESGYDMQDAIVLVRFSDIDTGVGSYKGELEDQLNGGKSNNGHGNNIDGVDSSNPGNAPFNDSDSSVDDEKLSNREYSETDDPTENDYSDYDTSHGCGHAGGGKPKDKSKKKDK